MASPPNLESLYAEADRATRAGELARAEGIYREILAAAPAELLAQRNLGMVLASTGQYALAHPFLEAVAQVQIDKNHALALAECRTRAGQFEGACAVLESLLERMPGLTAATMALARTATLMGDDVRAVATYRAVLDRDPHNPDVLNAYAALIGDRAPAQACQMLRAAIADGALAASGKCKLAIGLARIVELTARIAEGRVEGRPRDDSELLGWHCQDELRQAEDFAAQWCAEQPANGEAWRQRGIVAAARGDFSQAEVAFKRFADAGGTGIGANLSYDPAVLAPFDPGADPPPIGPSAEFVVTANFVGEHIFYIGCDLRYLRNYAYALVRSIDATCAAAQIHLHIMDLPDDARPEIAAFVASLPRSRIAVTTETLGFADAPSGVRSCVYSVSRLCVAMQLARFYRRTFWLLDADGLFNRDPRPSVDALAACDIATILRMLFEPWTLIAAGTVVVRPTKSAWRYAALVDGFLRDRLARGDIAWGTDQLALYCAWYYLRTVDDAFKMSGLTQSVVDMGDDEHSCIWLQSGRRKTIAAAHADSDGPAGPLREWRYVERFRRFNLPA